MYRRWLLFTLLIAASSAEATMRCAHGIVSDGELISQVLRKCASPQSRQVIQPAIAANGQVRYKSVTIEDWVYGPENGLYRYLRFIDGRLANIRTGRE